MSETKRHTIWQDAVYDDEENWRDAWEDYKSDCDCPDITLNEFIEMSNNINDERANLDIEVPEGILIIANLGLWHGTRHAYSDKEPTNVRDCLYGHCGGYLKFYVEDGEFMAEETHHDGTNHYKFRKWASGVSDEQKDELRNAIYNGEESKADRLIYELTESLAPEIAKVYGW